MEQREHFSSSASVLTNSTTWTFIITFSIQVYL